jgi:FkbM family methyltransferase
MKERLSQGFLAVEKRTRGNRLRKLLGRSIRRFSPGFVGAWEWYINRTHLAKVKVLGRPMYLDLRDVGFARPLYEKGVHEPAETDFLAKVLRPGMTFVDIGANIGYYTILGAAAVGKEGRVIAFEPEPHNLEILKKNIALNRFGNVVIENKAISDRAGPAELFLSEDNYGDHRIYRGRAEKARPSVPIETVSLDEYVRQRGLRVDVIKMDIQGAEFAALQGMRKTLAENEDIILVTEFWPLGLTAFGVRPEDFLHELPRLGFRIYELTDCALVEAITLEKLGDRGTHLTGEEHIDLVASRLELSPNDCHLRREIEKIVPRPGPSA